MELVKTVKSTKTYSYEILKSTNFTNFIQKSNKFMATTNQVREYM